MAKYWIYQGQIAGISDPMPPEQWPTGFTQSDGPDAPLELLYWDAEEGRVLFKPAQPGPDYTWNDGAWQPPPAPPDPDPDWQGFNDALGAAPALLLALAAHPLFPALIGRLKDLSLRAGKPWGGSDDVLVGLWNAQRPTLTDDQRGILQAAIDEHVPQVGAIVGEDGGLVVEA